MEDSIPDLCNLTRYSPEQALDLARQRNRERPTYHFEISRFFTAYILSQQVDLPVAERALDILSEIAPPSRLVSIMRTVIQTEDSRLRSNALLFLSRRIDDLPMLEKLATDNDPRIRANAVAALWGRQSPTVEGLFLGGLRDSNRRVVGNSIYGLCLIDREKHLSHLENLAKHRRPLHRSAAAWIIGKIGEARHGDILKPLVVDGDAAVRSAVFRAIRAIRSVKEASAEIPQPRA